MNFTIKFLGAAGTVTGSKFLTTISDTGTSLRFLVDCGLFQGKKELRTKNWQPFPHDATQIDSIFITHAHLDHAGYLPRLCRMGFKGDVYCTEPTRDLLKITLLDSAKIQEEEAEYANRKGFSKHKPALPLYNTADAEKALDKIKILPYEKLTNIAKEVNVLCSHAGHILGSVMYTFNAGSKSVLFTGDIGRFGSPVMPEPFLPESIDTLILESTYGDRTHEDAGAKEILEKEILESVDRKGVIVIPAFTIGRTQTLLYLIRELEDEKRIPVLSVFMDSPMAIDVTQLYRKHADRLDPETRTLVEQGDKPLLPDGLKICRSRDESMTINSVRKNAIIISASGMATAGRILHHLKIRMDEPENTVIFPGYQAAGTRGRRILDGEKHIKIHGRYIPVKAKIVNLEGLSAHADYREILSWLERFDTLPKKIFLVHGEPESSQSLAQKINEQFDLVPVIPGYLDEYSV